MSQTSEQEQKTGINFSGLIDLRAAGGMAIRPVVFGYETATSVLGTVAQWELLQNLGGVTGVALGLREGSRPLKLEGKPAKIDTFEHGDPWGSQAKATQR